MTNLRSGNWLNAKDVHGFIRRGGLKAQGFSEKGFKNKPVIGICNSWSELTHCNGHLREVAESVKRGVLQAGGLPLEFPVISLGEPYMLPTAMLFRNLMAMDVEESIRSNPLDAVVLLSGCDKTTPAMLMGAASADIPSIFVSGGPALKGNWRGEVLGSCTDCRKYYVELRAGTINREQYNAMEQNIYRSYGHCMVMGTASSMGCIVESLGMTLPGGAAIPAVDSRRYAFAEETGMRAVELVKENLIPSQFMTQISFLNAIRVLMALGGSTNAVIHLLALAGRLNVDIDLKTFDDISSKVPVLANLKPVGKYLMEDFFYAGGLPALLNEMSDLLDLDMLTVSGKTLGDNIKGFSNYNKDVIHSKNTALFNEGGLVVLQGNLAPNGAIIKHTAADPDLLTHRGKALVFDSLEEMESKIDDPDLDVDKDSVIILRNIGPKGGPGMPEWGFIPIPQKLLKKGIRDMVRITDGRMSGTAFGTIVLHVSPESRVGGPLSIVKNGDYIILDVKNRQLNLDLDSKDIALRFADYKKPQTSNTNHRGYSSLYLNHVLQAEYGCDFDFLRRDYSNSEQLSTDPTIPTI